MIWPLFVCIGLLSYWFWSLVTLEQNVKRAKSIGIPFVRVQIDAMNVLWLVFEPYFCFMFDLFRIGQGDFKRYARRGWFWREKEISHLQHGSVWALCSPVDVLVNVADSKACQEIFTRRQDFVRPNHLYAMMDVYGPNVATVGGSDWQRQRKILAAPFHEGTMKLVWTETLNQSRDMLAAWTDYGIEGAPGIARDVRTLSLDVLAVTGFRKSYKFKSFKEMGSQNTELQDYRDALKMVLDNALTLMILPRISYAVPFIPKRMRVLGHATKQFKQYMMDMLNTESTLLNTGEPGTGTLMTSFARALQDWRSTTDTGSAQKGPSSKGLSVNEVLGNIFAINFAGHDTTANTLAFAMLMLAAHPDIQDWVSEEIQVYIGDSPVEEWEYENIFPKLKRCLAVMYETLRLFPPVLALPKYSPKYSQPLPLTNGKVLIIPPGVTVMPSVLAIHMLPEYWGDDARAWKPKRWITNVDASALDTDGVQGLPTWLAREEMYVPKKGTYFPWSEGAQNCPGQKFSLVEFAAVMAYLFRNHRVNPVLDPGESLEEAQKRLLDVADDCDVSLLLRVRDADSTKLVWQRVYSH